MPSLQAQQRELMAVEDGPVYLGPGMMTQITMLAMLFR